MATILRSSPDVRPEAIEVPVTWPTMGGWLNLPKTVRAVRVGDPDAQPIIVLGGISSNAEVAWKLDGEPGWWWPMVDALGLLDQYCVIGIDFAADDLGEYAPTPEEQSSIINAALNAFQAPRPFAVIGASYGGMVALNWAKQRRNHGTRLIILSADAQPHSFATALRSIQRRVVDLGRKAGTGEGLVLARALAMTGYRTPSEFQQRFVGGLRGHNPLGSSDVVDYLEGRGLSFEQQFTEGRFLSLSASIDRQSVDPAEIQCAALLIGIHEDQIVPPCQMKTLHERWGGASRLEFLSSPFGHDAFLKEVDRLGPRIRAFLESTDL